MDISSELNKAYDEERISRRLRDVYTACIISLILVPAGLSLDYILYKDDFADFFIIRTVAVIGLCLLFLLNIFPQNTKIHNTKCIFVAHYN